MHFRQFRTCVARLAGAVAALALGASVAAAQIPDQLPDPATAEAILRSDPALQRELRERLRNSGMSEAQVRQRLRAAGYSEDLLNQYLGPQGARGGESVNDREAIDAVRALGLVGNAEADSLEALVTTLRKR